MQRANITKKSKISIKPGHNEENMSIIINMAERENTSIITDIIKKEYVYYNRRGKKRVHLL